MSGEAAVGRPPGRPPFASVHVVEDAKALAQAAAAEVLRLAREALHERGAFHLALAGGSTPRRLYERLVREDLAGWQFYWGDERCVPPASRASNQRMVRAALLQPAAVPEQQVHAVDTAPADPERVAAAYADELRRSFGLPAGELPRFDLLLLGMGADGHTASLFPHSPALSVSDALVAAAPPGPQGAARVTLTLPVINAARSVLLLVAGADKAPALRAVLRGEGDPAQRPACLVAPTAGSLLWIVDRAASGD